MALGTESSRLFLEKLHKILFFFSTYAAVAIGILNMVRKLVFALLIVVYFIGFHTHL